MSQHHDKYNIWGGNRHGEAKRSKRRSGGRVKKRNLKVQNKAPPLHFLTNHKTDQTSSIWDESGDRDIRKSTRYIARGGETKNDPILSLQIQNCVVSWKESGDASRKLWPTHIAIFVQRWWKTDGICKWSQALAIARLPTVVIDCLQCYHYFTLETQRLGLRI